MPDLTHGSCPDAETVAAYIDGVLTPPERDTVEQHLVTCGDCRDVIGDTIIVSRESSVAAFERPRRQRWVAGGAALAAAAALFLAVQVWRGEPQQPDVAELVQALGSARPFEPRLTGGFAHGQPPAVVRGGRTSATAPDVRIAAARIEQRAEKDPDVANLHASGIARAATGDLDGAVSRLRAATSGKDPSPAALADLGGVLLARAQRSRNPADAQAAATALDQSLAREPNHPEALFNRALALEFVASPDAAMAWKRYLEADADSGWATEARARLERLGAAPVRSTPK